MSDKLINLDIQIRVLYFFQAVYQRFPKHSLEAVGSAVFLRFINPAISKCFSLFNWGTDITAHFILVGLPMFGYGLISVASLKENVIVIQLFIRNPI